jgi:hypothetical protein
MTEQATLNVFAIRRRANQRPSGAACTLLRLIEHKPELLESLVDSRV